MKEIKVAMTGVVPMLMHSSAMVDKSNPFTIEIAKLTSKGSKKQTEGDRDDISRLEFLGGMWLGDGAPALPTIALEACFRDGAKAARKGKDAERGMWIDGDAIPLTYEGPRDPAALWNKRKQFALTVSVGLNGKVRVMRTRPIFRVWSCSFVMSYDPDVLDISSVRDAWDAAGKRGIGDWRPKFGRFDAVCS